MKTFGTHTQVFYSPAPAAGDSARKMAVSAPLKSETEQPPAEVVNTPAPEVVAAPVAPTMPVAPPTNRFHRLFTAITFKASDRAQVYENDKSKTRSKKVADVLLHLNDTSAYIKGSIYARIANGQTIAVAEFSFMGNAGQSCIATDDVLAKSDLDAFRIIVCEEYTKWLAENPGAVAGMSGISRSVALPGLTF